MRGFRSTLILLAVLLGLLGYIYFYEMKRPRPNEEPPKQKVFSVEADKIEELEIKASGGDRTVLRKSGTTWSIAEPLQTKADAAREACLTAAPSITGTNQTLAGLFAGRIAYPVFDADGARILAASAGDQKLYTAAVGDQPEWQRNGGKLAYRAGGSSANVSENGSSVAIAPAGAEFPTFSPDGSRVIYALQGKLYVVNADGSGSPIELGAGSAPTWGPGGLLAYSGCDGGGCGIMIRNPDNTDPPKRLTGSQNDIPTSWSPDGANISYYSNVGGNYDLFFVNTAGGVQQVTKNAGNNVGGAWGPDGSHVAFLSDRDGMWSLYIAKYDGTEATKIAIAPQGDWQRQRVSWVP